MAVILTGMGSDGVLGLRLLKRHGCQVVAQDEASCVVYGMPRAAVEAGVVDAVLPLDQIAARIASPGPGRAFRDGGFARRAQSLVALHLLHHRDQPGRLQGLPRRDPLRRPAARDRQRELLRAPAQGQGRRDADAAPQGRGRHHDRRDLLLPRRLALRAAAAQGAPRADRPPPQDLRDRHACRSASGAPPAPPARSSTAPRSSSRSCWAASPGTTSGCWGPTSPTRPWPPPAAGISTSSSSSAGCRADKLARYFTPENGSWKIRDELRALATFRTMNLLEPLAFPVKHDIIFCRNVAIYFTEQDRARLFSAIGRRPGPGRLPDHRVHRIAHRSLPPVRGQSATCAACSTS